MSTIQANSYGLVRYPAYTAPTAGAVTPTAVATSTTATAPQATSNATLSATLAQLGTELSTLLAKLTAWIQRMFAPAPAPVYAPTPSPYPAPSPYPTPGPTTTAGNLSADQLRSGNFSGCLFGSTTPSGVTPQSLQSELGRPLDINHSYYRFDDQVPSAEDKADVAAGRIPLISFNAITKAGAPVSWADIASGKYDARLRQVADGLKALGKPVMFTFNHEPENDQVRGTPADYRAAWQHISDIFAQEGASNVTKVYVTMGWQPALSAAYYPGNAVDWVAGDPYNWADTASKPTAAWRSFAQAAGGFYNWAKTTGKPIMIAETGSAEDPSDPNRKAQWITDMAATLKQWPQVKAVSYFDDGAGQGGPNTWSIQSPQAVAAWRAMAQDPYFSRH
ncbi:MAG TPA: hypothetical protein V6D47_04295 [Oscillatoriaceae cyanobacterium]